MKANKKMLYKSIGKADRTIYATHAGCSCVPACTIAGGSKAAHERAFDKDGYGF